MLATRRRSVFLPTWCPLVCLLLWLTGCVLPGSAEPEEVGVRIDLNDPVSRRIYDHQNARAADSLRRYLAAEEASYRYLAARALGSFPSLSAAVQEDLIGLLSSPQELIRTAAAYALGQTGNAATADSLAAAFDGSGRYRAFNAAVLAAVGRTGDDRLQTFVAGISTYGNQDTVLLAGQAYGLFYFATRELRSPAGDERMVALLLDPAAPVAARRPAAWYLQRFAVAVDSLAEGRLRDLLRTETDPDVLMGAVRTLGRGGRPAGRVALTRALARQPDWRVRTETLRALAGYGYASVREPVVEALRDPHPLVRRTAAAFLRDHGVATDATFYRQLARDSTTRDVSYELYAAAQRHLPLYFADYRGFLNYDLQQAYTAATDPYERVRIVRALGEYPWNYRNLYEYYRQSDQAPVRFALAAALGTISGREDFDAFFRNSSRRVRLDLAVYLREIARGGEVGPAYAAANALTEKAEVYRPLYPDLDWLDETLGAAELPRDLESYRALEAARAALNGRPAPPVAPAGGEFRAIDWDRIATDGGKEVTLTTAGGRVVLRLFPEVAPATVSGFLALAAEGYYDGRVFHRVVPNFVAQGGGPVGDGFGAGEFSLRTETPVGVRWERAGLVGMASAGKDTEGVQFFVTHRATPHLDGDYTIFGEVVEGQEILDELTEGAAMTELRIGPRQ